MATPDKTIDRPAARAALLTNLFVMPGVGSWMAGQRRLGATHFLMSLAGVFVMTAWACLYVFDWITHEAVPAGLGPHLWMAVAGMALFIGSWLWSLMSSLALLRAASAAPVAPPPASNQPPRLH